jgi:hypothetical protein
MTDNGETANRKLRDEQTLKNEMYGKKGDKHKPSVNIGGYYKDVRSIIEYPIEITRSGFAAIWERGGGDIKSGYALIIGNNKAGKKRGVFYKQDNPNGKHMLIMLNEGDKVIFGSCGTNAKEAMIIIRYVYKINYENKKAYLKSEYTGGWEGIQDSFIKMADALYRKLNTFRCIRYLYALPVREKENLKTSGKEENIFKNEDVKTDYGKNLKEKDYCGFHPAAPVKEWDNIVVDDLTDLDWDNIGTDLESAIDYEATIAEKESKRGLKEDVK